MARSLVAAVAAAAPLVAAVAAVAPLVAAVAAAAPLVAVCIEGVLETIEAQDFIECNKWWVTTTGFRTL